MSFRQFLTVLAIYASVSSGSLFADQTSPKGKTQDQFMVSVRLCEQQNKEAKVKVLAEPTLVTILERPCSLFCGGEIERKNSKGFFQIGTEFSCIPREVKDGKVSVTMEIQISSQVTQGDDPETEFVLREAMEIDSVVKLGQPKRFQVTPSRWFEVLIEIHTPTGEIATNNDHQD